MAVKKAKRKVVKAKAAKKVAKKPVKKVAAKKTAKRVVAKKVVAVKSTGPKVTSVSKSYSKSQVVGYIADQAGISKKEAVEALAALDDLIIAHLKSSVKSDKVKGFTLPGLLKCVVKYRKPKPKRKGINPATKEVIMIKAQPGRNVVRVRVLKRLKEIVK
jgi:nucleoid DNA-binding protein